MAMLENTVVRGILDVFDGYYITEQKKNFANLNNGILQLSDPSFSTTIFGKDILLQASGTAKVNAAKAVDILSQDESVNVKSDGADITIAAKRDLKESAGNEYSLNTTKDITIKSTNGGYSLETGDAVSIDINNKNNNNPGFTLNPYGDVNIGSNTKRTNGKFQLYISGDITADTTGGAYTINVDKDITVKSANGKASLEVKGSIKEKSETGGYELEVAEPIVETTSKDKITRTVTGITESATNGGKSTEVTGDITQKSSGGKFEVDVNKDINFKNYHADGTNSGGFTIDTYGDIKESSNSGKKTVDVVGDIALTATGDTSNFKVDVKKDIDLKSSGTGSYKLNVPGSITEDAGYDRTTNIGGNQTTTVGGNVRTTAGGGSGIYEEATNGPKYTTVKNGVKEFTETEGFRREATVSGDIIDKTANGCYDLDVTNGVDVKTNDRGFIFTAKRPAANDKDNPVKFDVTKGNFDFLTGSGNFTLKTSSGAYTMQCTGNINLTASNADSDYNLHVGNNIEEISDNGYKRTNVKTGIMESTDSEGYMFHANSGDILQTTENGNYKLDVTKDISIKNHHDTEGAANNGNYTLDISKSISEKSHTGSKVSDIYVDIFETAQTGNKTTDIHGNIIETAHTGSKTSTIHGDISETSEAGNKTTDINGNISETAHAGGKTSTIHGDISETSEAGDKSTIINGSILESAKNGSKTLEAKTGINESTDTGGYSFTANAGNITQNTGNGEYALNVTGGITQVSSGGNGTYSVGGAITETAGGAKTLNVGANSTENITGDKNTAVGTGITETTNSGGRSFTAQSGDILFVTNNGAFTIRCTGNITMESTAGSYTFTCSGNISFTSTNGTMSRTSKGNITDISTEGKYTLDVNDGILLSTKKGGIKLQAVNNPALPGVTTSNGGGNIEIYTNYGSMKLACTNTMSFTAARLKVSNSPAIYGTQEPSTLRLTNLEEGTIYFKLLD